MNENFSIKWHSYGSHANDMLRNLLKEQIYSDVTLVSDDQYHFKTHKFLLSACSTVFKNILDNTPNNALVYLRGIHHEDLDTILKFVYCGEVTISQTRVNDFLNVAKDLNIKDVGVNYQAFNFVNGENDIINHEDKNDKDDSNNALLSKSRNVDEQIIFDDKQWDDLASTENKIPISKNKKFYNRILNHNESIFSCKICDYQTKEAKPMENHINSNHEDNLRIFPCHKCDSKFKNSSHLKQHTLTKHEGIRYPCHLCIYQATTPSSLRRHYASRHESQD